ncbi:MAG: metallophosphoesterase [Saprospiraceae bacterium]|nr:metallophosphoesterase [Saprospiraceae bacterium]
MHRLLLLLLLSSTCLLSAQSAKDLITFGVIADCQYCDCPSTTQRFYRNSPAKLQACVDEFNKHDLAFAVHLGDYIDKDFASFDTLQPIIDQLKTPLKQVLGNHDFSVSETLKRKVPKRMGLSRRYYSFKIDDWRFIALDGNDLSTFASFGKQKQAEAAELLDQIKAKEQVNAQTWNGGISSKQIKWLEKQLRKADRGEEKVILFCHFPLHPVDPHNLWNDKQVQEILSTHPSVKAYFNGHNHAGAYGEKDGIHYLTFKGMVDTPNNTSYSIVKIQKDRILIEGFGRQEDQELILSKE